MGNSTYYPLLLWAGHCACLYPWDDCLALTPPPHNSKAAWSFLGLLRPTEEGWGHLLTPGNCLPPLRSLETGKTPGSPSLSVCFLSCRCLRALALLVISPSAVFEHPQLLPPHSGNQAGVCGSPQCRKAQPWLRYGFEGLCELGGPHTLPGPRLCSRS